jgi:hypothetical protein
MNDQQACGKWVGTYTYGEEYDESIRGKTVAFEMDLTVVKGIIKGECTEEEATVHFKQPASIEGSVISDTISFIKRYPHYWQNEKSGPRFLPKLPSQEISYSGMFVDDRFEGEWEITYTLIDAQGGAVSYKGIGTWFMKKK